ncbi:hypothetical protein FRC18_003774 [Serendipita sp. 400]|nr:hypothetical protein FRC18_003774 [Serendipita sp. 400]
MEAQLQAVWEEKLQRISGKGEEREQRLALFSKVWDAVLPRIQPKDAIKEINLDEDPDAIAFASLQDPAISRTAASTAFDAVRRKRELLRRDLDAAMERWREDGSVPEFATIFVTLLKWRATWARPFVKFPHFEEPEAFVNTFNSVLFDVLPADFPDALNDTEKDSQRISSFGDYRGFIAKYEFHVYKSLFDMRVSELFEIITIVKVDSPVLLDLMESMSKISGRSYLIRSLRQQIYKRLLHPGADTDEIIDFYIGMIRCLRIIDPQGVILFRVADPIRAYLRNRPDTIHHIVTELINEEGELAQEARAPIVAEIEHEDYSDPNWLPEPPDAGPKFRMLRPGDLISTLVSIYDSHDLFVKELQTLFASILLQSRDGTFDSEKQQIEILKLRFGESPLQGLDVMLADMQSTTRVNKQANEEEELLIKPAIVSRWFWPEPPELDQFKMPGQFAALQEEYNKRFQRIKPDKRLHWVHQMGTLKLAIELKDRTVEVNATPLEAAVIESFSEKSSWSQEGLSTHLGVKEKTLIGALISWNEEGVIEYQEHKSLWSVKSMLSNFNDGLAMDSIWKMLQYSPDRRSLEQLKALFQRLQNENLIENVDGKWRLV